MITATNLTPYPRRQVVRATVPCHPGEFTPLTEKRVRGVRSSVMPIGTPYSDDSARVLEAYWIDFFDPWQTKTYELETRQDGPHKWHWGPGLLAGGYQFSLHIEINGSWFEHTFAPLDFVRDGQVMRVAGNMQRVQGTPFVAALWLYLGSGMDVNPFELALFACDPNVPDLTHEVTSVKLVAAKRGMISLRHWRSRGARMLRPYRVWELMRDTSFGHGQGQIWHGDLITVQPQDLEGMSTAAASSYWPIWGMADDWMDKQSAYGALGHIPSALEDPPDAGDAMATLKFRWLHSQLNRTGDVWDEHPLGVTKTPSQTGGQSDFGICAAWDLLYTGRGELIEGYYAAAMEDAKRPSYYFEHDGRPLDPADHPLWRPWNGQTFPRLSGDLLGKDYSTPFETHGWHPKDHEHWSSNLLYTMTMLTGSQALGFLADREIMLLDTARTTHDTHPSWPTSNATWDRREGRPLQALMTLELIQQNDEMVRKESVRALTSLLPAIDELNPNWQSFDQQFGARSVVDGRLIPNVPCWMGWQSGLAFIGILALLRRSDQSLADLKDRLQRQVSSTVRYGVRLRDFRVAQAIRFSPEDPSPPDKNNREEWRASGFGLTIWTLPLIEWAAKFSIDPLAKQKAKSIIEGLDSERRQRLGSLEPNQDVGVQWSLR